jgi:hypothetical protein
MVAIRITVNGNFRNQKSVNPAALDAEYDELMGAIDAEVENLENILGKSITHVVSRAAPVIAGVRYTESITVTLTGVAPGELTEDMIGPMVDNLYKSRPYVGSGHAGLRPGEGNDALADAFPEISAEVVQAGGNRKKTRHAKRKHRATRRKNHRRS